MLIRVRFTKGDSVRFISHLDLMRTIERAVRRAGIPIALSEGYHPRPKIGYGPALPVGVSSEDEYADFQLNGHVDLESFVSKLNEQLPIGINISAAKEIDSSGKSIMALIETASYDAWFSADLEVIQRTLSGLLDSDCLEITRVRKDKKKQIDIRPLIFDLKAFANEGYVHLTMLLKTGSNGNLRPEEVLGLFPVEVNKARIHRTGLFVTKEGDLTPLEVGSEL